MEQTGAIRNLVAGVVGKISYYARIQNARTQSNRRKLVLLTVACEDDGEILTQRGLARLRQARLQRICQEASEQGALLAFEDLVNILLTSLSTIKRDMRLLRTEGISIPVYRKKVKLSKRV